MTSTKQDTKGEDLAARNDAWRGRTLAGETPAGIAAADGVSVATVRRGVKDATARALDVAEAAGAADRAAKAEAKKAERKLAAVPADADGSTPPAQAKTTAKAAPSGDVLTLDEVEALNPRWTPEDRTIVRERLAAQGAVEFRAPTSREYVRGINAEGKLVAWVRRAIVQFPKEFLPTDVKDVDGNGTGTVRLSTSPRRG